MALKVTGGWWTRFTRLASNSWIRRVSKSCSTDLYVYRQPVCSVMCQCFQLRTCDVALLHCDLQTVLASCILPTSTPLVAMVKLSIDRNRMLRYASDIHTNDVHIPSDYCCAVCRNASVPLILQILSMVVFGTCSCHLMCTIYRSH